MTTPDKKGGPSPFTIVALVILALILALLPALRGRAAVEITETVATACSVPPGAGPCATRGPRATGPGA